jgi:hypothetical protein
MGLELVYPGLFVRLSFEGVVARRLFCDESSPARCFCLASFFSCLATTISCCFLRLCCVFSCFFFEQFLKVIHVIASLKTQSQEEKKKKQRMFFF